MTIAGCFVTGEGVVLGADSTTTFTDQNGAHYFDHAQKLLQVDAAGCFGIVTWGWAGEVQEFSYRTNVARFGDELAANPAKTIEEAAARWSKFYWDALNTRFKDQLAQVRPLWQRWEAHRKLTPEQREANKHALTPTEEQALVNANIYVGFCIAGRALPDRGIGAYTVEFEPVKSTTAPKPKAVPFGLPSFWGAPLMIDRVISNYDANVIKDILSAQVDPKDPKSALRWNGSRQDLVDIFFKHELRVQPQMPIRDAVDFVHSAISMTCKWIRFAQLPPVCGGAVEVAVVTSDREFRWVRHKAFDVAI